MNASIKRIIAAGSALFVSACTYYPGYYSSYPVAGYYGGGGYSYYYGNTPGYYGYYPRYYGYYGDRYYGDRHKDRDFHRDDDDDRRRRDNDHHRRRDNDGGRDHRGNDRRHDRRGYESDRAGRNSRPPLPRDYRNAPYQRNGAHKEARNRDGGRADFGNNASQPRNKASWR